MTATPSMDRVLRGRIGALAASAAAGYFVLPTKLEAALDAERRVDALLADARSRALALDGPEGVIDQLADAVLTAAREGGSVPALTDDVATAEDIERRASIEQRVLERAAEAAERSALYCVTGEQVIVESIQPAHAACLDELRKLATKFRAHPVADPQRLLLAPVEVRNAYGALVAAADKYEAIRSARQIAVDMEGGRPLDVDRTYAELRNTPELHGARWAGRYLNRLAPLGPTDRLARLIWLVSGEPEPWCPTRAEQDAAAQAADEAARPKRGRPTAFAVIG